MGADENSAPELHQEFHNQADGAMGAMNGMIMGRSGFQPDMDLIQRQRTIQNMALMQQQLQQSIMQMQQMMYQYNQNLQTFQQNQQSPNMRAIQGPAYTCKSCKQALQMQNAARSPAPFEPVAIVNPLGLPPVPAPEESDTLNSREKRGVQPEQQQQHSDIWNRLHNRK